MRAVTGMAFGAIAGMVAGIVAALVLASAVGVFGFIEEGIETAAAVTVLYAFFGSIFAAVIGSLVGAIAGVLIGAFKGEAHAPPISAVLGAAPAVLVCVSIALSAAERPQSPGLQVAMVAIMVVAVIAYAGIGYGAGVFFRRAALSALARNEPV